MLAFNHLGHLGRLGNQMFQYASLRGIARNRGIDFCIPKDNVELFIPFNMFGVSPHNIKLLDRGYAPVAEERQFHFDELFFNMIPDEISIFGFFQSEKYFKHIEDEIRNDFSFKNQILDPCKEMMESVGEAVSLHVRRTDYLTNDNHVALDLEYYQNALSHIDNNLPVLVFSDDVLWCKKQELFSDDRFMISECDDHYVDLCLMSLCKHHIIANSSFSWWGAWLANSQNVFAPSTWLGPANAHKKTHDIYLKHWRVI